MIIYQSQIWTLKMVNLVQYSKIQKKNDKLSSKMIRVILSEIVFS